MQSWLVWPLIGCKSRMVGCETSIQTKKCKKHSKTEKSWKIKNWKLKIDETAKITVLGKSGLCKVINTVSTTGLSFCLIVFMFDHHTFCSLSRVRRHIIGCINHDIVVCLCSELHIRLSYYIHLGYGKKFLSHRRIEPRSFQLWAIYPTP